MKLAKTGAILSTAAVLGLGACGETETYNSSPARQDQVTAEFKKGVEFWKKQKTVTGIGKIASTKLVILNGDSTFACGQEEFSSASKTLSYCPNPSTVIAPAFALNEMNTTSIGAPLALAYHTGHELGHAVRNREGTAIPDASHEQARQAEEQAVDCTVGMQLAVTHGQNDMIAIGRYMYDQHADKIHGPNAKRVEALMQGGAGPCPE